MNHEITRNDTNKTDSLLVSFRVISWLKVFAFLIFSLSLVFSLQIFTNVVAARQQTSSLEDYRRRVHESFVALDALSARDEESADEGRASSVARTTAEVRRTLPPREFVTWEGGGLEVDNRWLHTALDNLARLPADTPEENRTRSHARITERLLALENRLDEIEAARAFVPARDKDAEKGRLASILRRAEFDTAKPKGDSALARFLKDTNKRLSKWLEDLFPNTERMSPGTRTQLAGVARYFIYAVCLAVIAFVVWKFGARFLRNRKIASLGVGREPRVVLGHALAPDETSADLLSEAEGLARGGDLRGAIRKAYVALLCELGDRKLIRLAQHKTNRDYLAALRAQRERPTLYEEMRPLTLNFERHWYGSEAATDQDWTDYRTRCQKLISE